MDQMQQSLIYRLRGNNRTKSKMFKPKIKIPLIQPKKHKKVLYFKKIPVTLAKQRSLP